MFAYIFYTALETGASGWMATQIHGVGYSESIGSVVTAGFWTGMALGRSLGGPLHRRLAEQKLVLGGLCLAIAVCLIALADPRRPLRVPGARPDHRLGLSDGLAVVHAALSE